MPRIEHCRITTEAMSKTRHAQKEWGFTRADNLGADPVQGARAGRLPGVHGQEGGMRIVLLLV